MNDEEMEALLGYYEPNIVPSYKEIHHASDPAEPAFDDSFG